VSPLGRDTTIEHNTVSEANRLSKTLTRFWDEVDVKPTADGSALQIHLDSKPLRTPLGNPLAIPATRPILANLIKHEWTSLATTNIKPHTLPLTSLSSRVIDLLQSSSDPEAAAKVGSRDTIIQDLLRYLDTDTLLVFSPKAEYEGALRQAQEDLYRPIIAEVEKFFDVKLTYLDSDRDGLRGNSQTPETREKVAEFLNSLNYYDLVALEKVTLTAKSLICGLLTVVTKSKDFNHTELEKPLEVIAKAATLEIIYQTEKWGEVEDTHDVDYQDIRRSISSAAILAFEEKE
jgi:ATP synthase F1 complex assembly factor 2